MLNHVIFFFCFFFYFNATTPLGEAFEGLIVNLQRGFKATTQRVIDTSAFCIHITSV